MSVYRCATCQREVVSDAKLPELYPFCSPRCRLVDLGRWLRGEYSIDRDLTPEDLSDPEIAEKLGREGRGDRA